MGQLEDIERLRKKRSQKQAAKRLGAFLLIVAIFFAGWFLWEKIKTSSITEQIAGGIAEFGGGNGYPLDFSGITVVQTETMGNTLLVLTDTHLHIYNQNGKLLRKVQHGFSKPVMKHSATRIVLYDMTSKQLRIETKTATVKEMGFDYPVLFAELSSKNDLLVITNAQRFLGEVRIYDSSLEEPVFSWLSAESYLYGAAFSQNANSFAISSIQVESGDLVSKLTIYRMDQEKPVSEQRFVGQTIHGLSYLSGGLQVLTDQGAYFYSEQGKEKAVVSFQNEPLRAFQNGADKSLAVLLGDYKEFKSLNLLLISGEGEQLASVSIPAQVDAVDFNDKYAALNLDNRVQVYNAKGEMVKEIAPEQEVLRMALGNGCLYYVTPSAIYKENIG